jgi:hypothetical protein
MGAAENFVKQNSRSDRPQNGEGVKSGVPLPGFAARLSLGNHSRDERQHSGNQLVVPHGGQMPEEANATGVAHAGRGISSPSIADAKR